MRILLTLAVTCLLLSSCIYSSDEMFWVEVDTDTLPHIGITTNLNPTDTFEIQDTILFKYEIVIDTGYIFFSQLFFNDGFIHYSEHMADSLFVDPVDTLSIGSYELYMEVFYKSSTGSLADRIDAEFLILDTTWQLNIGHKEGMK